MTSLSNEAQRTYHFKNKSITIVEPVLLSVSPNQSHRVLNSKGAIYVIDKQWTYIRILLKGTTDPEEFFNQIYS